MVHIVPFEASMMPSVIALWNICIGSHYPLTERLLVQNVLDDPFAQREGNLVAVEDAQIVGWVLARCLDAVPPELAGFRGRGSIGALCVHPQHRRRGIGSMLYERAETFTRRRGALRLTVVHYPHHLLPGIPSEAADVKVFFDQRGFQEWSEAYDLRRQLADPALEFELERGMQPQTLRSVFRPAERGEEQAIVDFVGREFPGGWHYDTKWFFGKGGSPTDIILVLEDGTIIGFCHTFTPRSVQLRGSTHWSALLGERWGGLGPIGIAATHRHRGLGLALLCASISQLKKRGVDDMVIDWTGLPGFYGRLGFRIWKRYWQGSKSWAAPPA